MQILDLIGHLHPLLVHLPIGFLLLAILMEFWPWAEPDSKILGYIWLLGAIGALLSAITGLMLIDSGRYIEHDFFWHKWLGIILALLACFAWWTKTRSKISSSHIGKIISGLVLILVFVTGHLGGDLTHGKGFLLKNAPTSVQDVMGYPTHKASYDPIVNNDSISVYSSLVKPILDAKCVACHNQNTARGALDLTSVEAFKNGGFNGPVLVPGNSSESILFKRITLSPDRTEFMPPDGIPLTYRETRLIEWWIDSGPVWEEPLKNMDVPEDIGSVLIQLYKLDTKPKPWYETVVLPSLDSTKVLKLQEMGYTVKFLSKDNTLLDIKYAKDDLNENKLEALNEVAEYITWLSLANSNVEDGWLSIIPNFSNLTRLQLERTAVTDSTAKHISVLEHLETLNLYKTQITDASLGDIETLESLKRIYLWGSKVSEEGIANLRKNRNDLEVIAGISSK